MVADLNVESFASAYAQVHRSGRGAVAKEKRRARCAARASVDAGSLYRIALSVLSCKASARFRGMTLNRNIMSHSRHLN